MPFSSCDSFIKFVKAAEPDSVVFQKMASSRQTITRKLVDMHQKMNQADVVSSVMKALFLPYIIDEIIGRKLKKQLGIYIRYINLEGKSGSTFLVI